MDRVDHEAILTLISHLQRMKLYAEGESDKLRLVITDLNKRAFDAENELEEVKIELQVVKAALNELEASE